MANYFSWKSINLSHCDFYHFIFTSIGWIFVLLKKACLFFLYLLYQSILFCFRHLLLSYSMATSFNLVSVILLTYLLHFTFSNFFPIFLNTSMAGPFSSFFPVFDLCLVASTFSDSLIFTDCLSLTFCWCFIPITCCQCPHKPISFNSIYFRFSIYIFMTLLQKA